MNTQPEALRLADVLEGCDSFDNRAAAELRRLHALNAELLEALKGLVAWADDLRRQNPEEDLRKARAAIAKAEGEQA